MVPIFDIPGYGSFDLRHVALDFNGTLAVDGLLRPGVLDRLRALARSWPIHVVTADTYGHAKKAFAGQPFELIVLPADSQAEGKREYIRALGAQSVIAIGNGRNDRLMLEEAGLAIAVVMIEGAATESVVVAAVLVPDAVSALDLLLHPLRLIATLRG
jgi:soluble P-type ATPase